MKKLILLGIFAGVSMSASAQRMKVIDDTLDKHVLEVKLDGPAMASVEMLLELSLTPAQYEQVVQLNTARYKQLEEVQTLYADDDKMRSKAMYSINLEADKQLGAMLDPKQLRQYMQLENKQQQTRLVSDNADK